MSIQKIFLAGWMALAALQPLHSQMVIVPEAQAGGMVTRQQLFSMLVNNFTGTAKNAVFLIQVVDRGSSQVLLEATSSQVPVGTGAKRITYNELSPLLVSQSVPEFSLDRSLSLPLPVGDYVICYKMLNADERRDVLASECVKIGAEPLSPPQLVQPADGAALTESRPLFTWTPPSPLTMFSSLSYDVIIVPRYKDQSAAEAVQRNLPLLSTPTVSNSLSYPASFSNLEPGKDYAWQVVAKDGSRYGGKSEAWSFTLVPDSVKQIIESAAYIRIQDEVSAVSMLQQGVLKIDYVNRLADSTITAIITDMTEKKSRAIVFELPLTRGQNLIRKDINRLARLEEGHVYRLTLRNNRKEELSFRFTPKYYF